MSEQSLYKNLQHLVVKAKHEELLRICSKHTNVLNYYKHLAETNKNTKKHINKIAAEVKCRLRQCSVIYLLFTVDGEHTTTAKQAKAERLMDQGYDLVGTYTYPFSAQDCKDDIACFLS